MRVICENKQIRRMYKAIVDPMLNLLYAKMEAIFRRIVLQLDYKITNLLNPAEDNRTTTLSNHDRPE